MLLNCLFHLGKQTVDDFVVYLVVNDTTESTTAFESHLENTYPDLTSSIDLRSIPMDSNTGFTGAVNAGITAALENGVSHIALLNDDTVVSPQWLEKLQFAQEKTGADMIASVIYRTNLTSYPQFQALNNNNSTAQLDSQGFTFLWRGKALALDDSDTAKQAKTVHDHWLAHGDLLTESQIEEPFGADAAAALYTRELFETTGLFPDDFFAYLEDVALALQARKAGMRCVVAEDAVVYHHKHGTSAKSTTFKVRQDLMNWWRIVLRYYPTAAWKRFLPGILLERLRNVSGYLKTTLGVA